MYCPDVLQAVRLEGALYFDVCAADPVVAETPPMWKIGSMVMPQAEHVIAFHIMLRGSCWVETFDSADPPVEIADHDIIVFPHGHGHIFVTELGQRNPPNIATYASARGGPLPLMLELDPEWRDDVHFVCGYFGCKSTPFNPLLRALPSQIISRGSPGEDTMEVELIRAAVEEARSARSGGETVLARLSELLFVRVLRRYVEGLPEHARGWFAGLRDIHVGRALELIHGDPARDWTVEALARESGLSRAAFAERFADHVAETPMRYLAKWRMQLASSLLDQPGVAIEAIAEQVGYRSESAFNRAFKSIVGIPPGAWRLGQRPADDLQSAADGLQGTPQDQDDLQKDTEQFAWVD